jgi:hypothetical protein
MIYIYGKVVISGVGLKRVWLPDSCKVAYLEKNKLRNIELIYLKSLSLEEVVVTRQLLKSLI